MITTTQINEPDSVEFSAQADSTIGPRLGLALSPANGTATTMVAALDLAPGRGTAGTLQPEPLHARPWRHPNGRRNQRYRGSIYALQSEAPTEELFPG